MSTSFPLSSLVPRTGSLTARRVVAAAVCALVSAVPAGGLAAPATAAAAPASSVSDSGSAVVTWVLPEQTVQVGDVAQFTVTMDGNGNAGEQATMVLKRYDTATDETVVVTNWNPVLTTEPQSRTFDLDTSTTGGFAYIYDIDAGDYGCEGAMFSFTVLPGSPQPPTVEELAVRIGKVPDRVRAGTRVTVPGRVLTDDGISVSGVKAVLQRRTSQGWTSTKATDLSDDRGRFSLSTPKLKTGTHRFRVWAPALKKASAARTVKATRS